MQVRIDTDKCQGHSLCVMSAPDTFDLSDDGVAQVVQQPGNDADRDAAQYAASSCPEQAIVCENGDRA